MFPVALQRHPTPVVHRIIGVHMQALGGNWYSVFGKEVSPRSFCNTSVPKSRIYAASAVIVLRQYGYIGVGEGVAHQFRN